ncbi:MAG: SDR family oxidoreductase [Saprospiraceae bacterium]|nr:SDR family oxidoreductase [Saprospiraceae bacterium]
MQQNKTALITGASQGLGYQLAERLAQKGWNLIITARNPEELFSARKRLSEFTEILAIAGDVRDEIHLLDLVETIKVSKWKLDVVVNNASALGISPLKRILEHPVENLHVVFHTNIIAPISLLQKIKPLLNAGAKIINVSSDAAVEAYEAWGAYSGSKAGLDHITNILGKENPNYYFYSFDPGDMRTAMHQAAYPDEDISDRPQPKEYAVPALIELIESQLTNGRYTIHSFKKEVA